MKVESHRHRSQRFAALTAAAIVLAASPSQAADRSMASALKQMMPTDRMVQACYLGLEDRIAKETPFHHVDRVVLDVTSKGRIDGDVVKGKGAAFRDDGNWYRLAFKCAVTPDHMQVTQMKYRVVSNSPIPTSDWDEYRLFP